MPAANVFWPPPLTRLPPWFTGQMGVPGTDSETGLREHCTGAVFYVDPNYPGVSDERDGTDPTAPLATVQKAVDQCQDYHGDIIVVMQNATWEYAPGTPYGVGINEEVILDKAGVRLIGLTPSTLGVPWAPASDGGTCLTVSAMDCTVEGFAFWEGAYTGCRAIYAEWDGATLWGENLTVRHCFFSDTVDIGIQLEYAWYCNLHNNTFDGCDVQGIYVDPVGSGADYAGIHDNAFLNCVAAIVGEFGYSQLYRNRVYNADAQAGLAATNEGFDLSAGNHNHVADNFFSCLLPAGAPGDYDDLNTASATDAWINNHCMDGDAVTNPA